MKRLEEKLKEINYLIEETRMCSHLTEEVSEKIIEDALKKAENYLAKIKKHLNKELGHQKTDEHFKNLFNELGGTTLGKVYMGDGVWLNADGSMFCED